MKPSAQPLVIVTYDHLPGFLFVNRANDLRRQSAQFVFANSMEGPVKAFTLLYAEQIRSDARRPRSLRKLMARQIGARP
jgi:hypothetical protein